MCAAVAAIALLGLTACGDSSASCDFPDAFHCTETSGSSRDISDWKDACSAGGGSPSGHSCSDANLIGCCSYTFGGEFTECFYDGFASDPEAYCALFSDSVWDPATP
jgi:hypothetical protein